MIPTFREYVNEDWAPRFRKLKPSTQKRTEQGLRRHLLPRFGDTQLTEITRRDIYRWFDSHSETAPADANRTLAILQGILSHAVEREIISISPANRIKTNRIPPRTRFLNQDEIQRLHRALDDYPVRIESGRQQVDILRILLMTGMRCSEVSQMQWQEVVYGPANLGPYPIRIDLKDSKTGARSLPVSRTVGVLIHEQPSREQSRWVFPNRCADASKPRSKHITAWYRIRKVAGLGDVRIHDLRHTFASHAAMNGVPIPVIARLLGHSTTRVTSRYMHMSDESARDATAKMEGLLNRDIVPIGRSSGFRFLST